MLYVTYPWYTQTSQVRNSSNQFFQPSVIGDEPWRFYFLREKKKSSQKSKLGRKLSIENEKSYYFPGYFL